MAGVVVGMFGNLPRFAVKLSLTLPGLANERQQTLGNPYWNDRCEFLFDLFSLPYLASVKEMLRSLRRMIAKQDHLADPEVEILAKLNLASCYFWSNESTDVLHQEHLAHVKAALESRNYGVVTLFGLHDSFLKHVISGDGEPYLLFRRSF